jgi:hypothetical protein
MSPDIPAAGPDGWGMGIPNKEDPLNTKNQQLLSRILARCDGKQFERSSNGILFRRRQPLEDGGDFVATPVDDVIHQGSTVVGE